MKTTSVMIVGVGGQGSLLASKLLGKLLLARGYDAADAAALAVWLHGRAGDLLTETRTAEAWSSQDLLDVLYQGFVELYDGGEKR